MVEYNLDTIKTETKSSKNEIQTEKDKKQDFIRKIKELNKILGETLSIRTGFQ